MNVALSNCADESEKWLKPKYPVLRKQLRNGSEWSQIALESDNAGAVDLGAHVRQGSPADIWCAHAQKSPGGIKPEDNPRTLGLHWTINGQGAYIRPSHFVGAAWLAEPVREQSEGLALVVRPKLDDFDALATFAAVADHGEVELESLFGCEPEGAPIPGVTLPDFTLLQVAAFLATLARFVQRDLRQGFSRVRENLTGRVKGRIRLASHLRENLAFGRVDRAACEFTVMSLDTLENRILKSALEVCGRYLANNTGKLEPQLVRWLAMSRAALAGVPQCRVTARDWGQARKTGLMRAYARPLALARMILTRLRVDADGRLKDVEIGETIPFFLDMNALFEAWVGLWLSKTGIHFKAQQERRLPFLTFRPDFVARHEKIVVDAKYKDIAPQGQTKPSLDNLDVYQALAYARLLAKADEDQEPSYRETWLAFPGDLTDNPMKDVVQQWERRHANDDTWVWADKFCYGILKVDLPKRATY